MSSLTILLAVFFAVFFVIIFGKILIPKLHSLKVEQNIRQEGPKSHQKKSGTPTMGGILIVGGIILGTLPVVDFSREILFILFLLLGNFAIGFTDDYIKIVLKQNLGLRPIQKFVGQIGLSFLALFLYIYFFDFTLDIWLPFLDNTFNMGIFFYPFFLFVVVGMSNAVNLTDGLDGLAAGTTVIAGLAYTFICIHFCKTDLAVFCMAMVASCVAFLYFNRHPAKVFMGDTGSLALGGAFAALAILTKTEILLAIIGGVFVVETLSVILQVWSFKTRGKRIFLMSPLHHHFELKGWSETKVVLVFWAMGILCSLVGLLLLKLS